jgi:SpoVK/Ycf46/Vps4 family AAA+-type ATPase
VNAPPRNSDEDRERHLAIANQTGLWSEGQRQAYRQLTEFADAFFFCDWGRLGLRPRLDVLLSAPSGAGKSYLVRHVARTLGLPILRLSFNEWIVMGARETPHTLARIHSFVSSHAQGIVHIDELDKFKASHSTDWSTSVHLELFMLLDRALEQPGKDFVWTTPLVEKLGKMFMIVGTGTWQALWNRKPNPPLGFQKESHAMPIDIQLEIERSNVIPEELLRRFCSEIILMPAALEEDYRAAARAFRLDVIAQQLNVELDYREAVKRNLGARWLEEQLGRLLRVSRRTGKPLFPPNPPLVEEGADISFEDDLPFDEIA